MMSSVTGIITEYNDGMNPISILKPEMAFPMFRLLPGHFENPAPLTREYDTSPAPHLSVSILTGLSN
jgi:hypothetical protein